MAQEVAVIETPEQNKAEADVARSLAEFLRSYSPENTDSEPDTLDWRYQIDTNSPLPDFDAKSAKAYAAFDKKLPGIKQYVAQICSVGALPRMEAITPLINSPNPHMTPVIAAGVVNMARLGGERFVIIYERPKGRKLSSLISASKKPPGFEFICQNIIMPIALAIQQLSEIGIIHGYINCDNIYFHNTAVLGPCLIEPCGLSQPFYYEPLERMQALTSGKGMGDGTQDYYALAVVVLHVIYGMNHFSGINENILIRKIMKEGAFNALTRNKDMPEIFYDFFRGLLNPNTKDRWGFKYLKAWLDGKRYNVLPPPPSQEAIRPFELEGNTAYTRREVAHLFFENWQAVPEVIINGQLSSWVAISLRNKELNEYLLNVAKGINSLSLSSGKKNDWNIDEQIMRIIAVFDHTGPVRMKKLAFHIDGIGNLFSELLQKDAQQEMQLITSFIEFSMFNFVLLQKNKEKENEKSEDNKTGTEEKIVARLEKLRSIIKNSGLGFGVERIFYDLNPTTQCLSPLFAGKYVANLPALLKALEGLAPNLARDKDPIDSHIAAFLASHLGISHEIYLTGLDSHEALAKSPALISLKLLASAQRRTKVPHLPALSHWLGIRILPLLGDIRSKSLRRKLLIMLEKSAKSGNLTKMSEIFVESSYAWAEATAFAQAMAKFKKNASDIVYYNRQDVIEAHSKKIGTRMAHRVAIGALIISFYIAIRDG